MAGASPVSSPVADTSVTAGKTPTGRSVNCGMPSDMPTPLKLFATASKASSTSSSTEDFLKDNEAFAKLTKNLSAETAAAVTGMISVLSAQNQAKPSSSSARDIDSQHTKDTAALDVVVKDDQSSFLAGLFAIRRARTALKSWRAAAHIEKQTVDSNGAVTSTHKVDLLSALESLKLVSMEKWAKDLWAKQDATRLAQDGQSVCHSRRCLAEFLFKSVEESLARTIQHHITPSELWNDGPLVWTHLVLHFFPTPKALRSSLLSKVKGVTLASFSDDITEHTRDFRESLILLETEDDNIELKGAFFREMATSSFPPLVACFRDISVNLCLGKRDERIPNMLAEADKIANLSNSDALPFKKTNAPLAPEIATLISAVGSHNDSMVKTLGCVSNLQNEVKQLRESSKQKDAKLRTRRVLPSFCHDAPDDKEEIEEFNGSKWTWCQLCNDGKGCWSTTHNTKGTGGFDAHRGFNPKRKSNQDQASQPTSKRTRFNTQTKQPPKTDKSNKTITGPKALQAAVKNAPDFLDLKARVKAVAANQKQVFTCFSPFLIFSASFVTKMFSGAVSTRKQSTAIHHEDMLVIKEQRLVQVKH